MIAFELAFDPLFYIGIYLPVDEDVPLGQAVWVGMGGGPAATQSQNKRRIDHVQETHFYINSIPQHLGQRIV